MASTRLPGKVLLEASGKSMLEHLVRRLRKVESIDQIILATTKNPLDDILIEFAEDKEINYFRGSENDVMSRVVNAAKAFNVDIIVEITGDCPIIDPLIIEQTIRMFKSNDVDYVSNAIVRSYPDGMDTQVFKLDTLIKSQKMTTNALDQEHVTRHIRNNQDIFTCVNLIAPPNLHYPDLGLTLDEHEDFVFIKTIIECFEAQENPLFNCQDTIELIRNDPALSTINSHITRTIGN